MSSTTAYIVEDVPAAAENLQRHLAEYCPEIEILGHADRVVSAAKAIRELQPQLLFLDVELPDGTGFDLLDILGDYAGKIIFTTAMEHYALKAFRYAAADYLLKPIDAQELQTAVRKVLAQVQSTEQRALLREAAHRPADLKRIVLASQDKLQLVDMADIIRCEADDNYTQVYLKNGKKTVVSQALKHYSQMLEEHGFLRVHQSHLINTAAMQEYIKTDGGYLRLSDGSRIPVSVRRRPLVLAYFKN